MASTVRKDTRKLQQLIRETPDKADQLVRGAAQEIVNDIVLAFSDQSPSPPGQPPGVDTGELRASMGWTADGRLRAVVHDGVEYGVYLELGSEKMPARPFVAPVVEEWRQRKFGQFAHDFGVFDFGVFD